MELPYKNQNQNAPDIPVNDSRKMPLKLAQLLNAESDESDVARSPEPSSKSVVNDASRCTCNIGLMTPESSTTQSPHHSLEGNREDLALSYFVRYDLRKSSLTEAFPHLLWDVIVHLVKSHGNSNAFTKGEMDLIVSEWKKSLSPDYNKLVQECFMRTPTSLQIKVSFLKDNYSSNEFNPSPAEVSALETCYSRELYLVTDILRYLPTHSPDNLRLLIRKCFPHRPSWLVGELSFLDHCIKENRDVDYVVSNLIFRRPSDSRNKFASLRRKQLKDLPVTPSPPPLSESERALREHINWLVDNDLTASGIKENADCDYETCLSEISRVIAEKGGSDSVPFTKPETELIKKKLTGVISDDKMKEELIFRGPEEIEQKTRNVEIACFRQTKFSSHTERLLYEAKWYTSMEDSTQGRRKRLRRERPETKSESVTPETDGGLIADDVTVKQEEKDDAEVREREAKKAARIQRRKATMEKREQEKLKRRVVKSTRSTRRLRRLRNQTSTIQRTAELLEEAKWFQSVTGDGSNIEEGAKRLRRPTTRWSPDIEEKDQKKKEKKEPRVLKQKVLLLKPGSRGRGRPRMTDYTSESESELEGDNNLANDSEESTSSSDGEEYEGSPFEPLDIAHDTRVPLNGRMIFNPSIHAESPQPEYLDFSYEHLMVDDTDSIPFCNQIAYNLVRDHANCYNDLPPSFPKLFLDDKCSKINPKNIVRIRSLLYPHHTEQFLLASPKSNQFDPVLELYRIFQLHYTLYFSQSEVLKDIIQEDFCKKLKQTVENDKFAHFMSTIDKWNLLMMELSPYPLECDPSIDVNPEIRSYLPKYYRLTQSAGELKLSKIYAEIMQTKKGSLAKQESTDEPGFKSRHRKLRPANYPQGFFKFLKGALEISRFCAQQVLLKAYVRIVSPNSRKLRSYKAFTSEVYGELLPSFVSEVLTKIDFKPWHKFYDLGSGVGNTVFQAALEFGARHSGGCELMNHASYLTSLQLRYIQKLLKILGLAPLNVSFALDQSFVANEEVKKQCIDSDVILVNNYLFEFPLNFEVGKLLYGLRPGSKIISLKNFIPPRYKAGNEKTIFDYLKVEKFEMSEFLSVSWTANKVPYYISTVELEIRPEHL